MAFSGVWCAVWCAVVCGVLSGVVWIVVCCSVFCGVATWCGVCSVVLCVCVVWCVVAYHGVTVTPKLTCTSVWEQYRRVRRVHQESEEYLSSVSCKSAVQECLARGSNKSVQSE